MHHTFPNEVRLSDSDIVNVDQFLSFDNANLYVAHDHGFVVGAAFAECLQDALDELADNDKLAGFLVSGSKEEVEAEYGSDMNGVSYLGNYGDMYDIQALTFFEVPAPPMSIVALLDANAKRASQDMPF